MNKDKEPTSKRSIPYHESNDKLIQASNISPEQEFRIRLCIAELERLGVAENLVEFIWELYISHERKHNQVLHFMAKELGIE